MMSCKILILILVLLQNSFSIRTNNHLVKKNNVNLQKIPQKMFAAEIHYSRIPYQYWEHRLKMVKAMGFNALSVYVMWNFHEIQKGKFDYENAERNLGKFLELANNLNFKVLLRPGPYVCAEWDFGGFPARLLSIPQIKLRQNDNIFLNEVKPYFQSLQPLITKYSEKNGGPIILLQIQNQYASYGSDKSYIQALRTVWDELKIYVDHYYVDVYNKINVVHWEGANIGLNDAIREDDWVKAKIIQPVGYLFGGEIYSGWLTHWGEAWQGKTLAEYTKEFSFLMNNNHSFSMYMAHGGTNFGLWAGANSYKNEKYDYRGHVTSYDYAAPINEQGSPTDKYNAFRNLAKAHADWQIPDMPAKIDMIKIKPFILSAFADLMENLPKPAITSSDELVVFEDVRLKMWNQGFVLYEMYLNKGIYSINFIVHDFCLIYLNGKFQGSFDRSESTSHNIKLQVPHDNSVLRILVEAMGHVNFDHQMVKDFKGLIQFKASLLNQIDQDIQRIEKNQQVKIIQSKIIKTMEFQEVKVQWNIYKIPIDEKMLKWKNKSATNQFPRLFRYNLTLEQTGDTYLNMQKWKKGYVFVNGYNLGRYWNKGPQYKLFLPGVWLKKGINDIVVFELLDGAGRFVQGDLTLQISNSMTNEENSIDWGKILLKSISDD